MCCRMSGQQILQRRNRTEAIELISGHIERFAQLVRARAVRARSMQSWQTAAPGLQLGHGRLPDLHICSA